MIYYFIHCKKIGHCCDDYHFLPYDEVGKFLFENQSHDGYDKLKLFRVESVEAGMMFTVYLFNEFIYPPMEELLKAMSAFFNVSSKEITFRFYSERGEA